MSNALWIDAWAGMSSARKLLLSSSVAPQGSQKAELLTKARAVAAAPNGDEWAPMGCRFVAIPPEVVYPIIAANAAPIFCDGRSDLLRTQGAALVWLASTDANDGGDVNSCQTRRQNNTEVLYVALRAPSAFYPIQRRHRRNRRNGGPWSGLEIPEAGLRQGESA